MAEPTTPYWLLIAVLASTRPLTQPLAMRLYQAALELYRSDGSVSKLTGDLASGEVRNLRKSVSLGSIGGPGFEAELETPQGHSSVRFLLTRQALEPEEGPRPTAN